MRLNSHGMAMAPDGRTLWVASEVGNKVLVVDIPRARVVAQIAVGRMPHTIVLSRDGASAYTANMDDNSVSVISTATRAVVATIPVGKAPSSIAILGP